MRCILSTNSAKKCLGSLSLMSLADGLGAERGLGFAVERFPHVNSHVEKRKRVGLVALPLFNSAFIRHLLQ